MIYSTQDFILNIAKKCCLIAAAMVHDNGINYSLKEMHLKHISVSFPLFVLGILGYT